MNKFCVLILTWQRSDRVVTIETLRKCGYTGEIFLVVDDKDKELEQYKAKYGDKVLVFSKDKVKEWTDDYTNTEDTRAVIYARNVAFELAKSVGYEYFIELDDDYTEFQFRFDENCRYYPAGKKLRNLDFVFDRMVDFMKANERITSIAFSQGGDFIGGKDGGFAQAVMLKRKCMNSFLCSTERPFQFYGKINEDVNAYTLLGSRGHIFFTMSQISLEQMTTQSNPGGLTDIYLDSGTYVKSFYSVMGHPSSIKVTVMGTQHKRIHHRISWDNTVPKIIRQEWRKQGKKQKKG